MHRMSLRPVLFIVFTLSGFSGLIYESLWTHYLKLFLGHAAYAQSLVLAIFMGGLAVGSWLCSRYSTRWRNLVRGYALVEGLVGFLGLGFHWIFDRCVTLAYTTIIPGIDAIAGVTALKWGLGSVLILPQSILLGMTFPLMTGGFIRRFPDRKGESLAMLYFCNSIGGAVGVLVSGFVLIRILGLPGTGAVAGLINLALAGVVLRLTVDQPEPRLLDAGDGTETRPRLANLRLLLIVSLLTGAASFIYEVGWIRMLSLVLGSSTHAFELMVSAFIFGLAFGGLWIRRRIDSFEPLRFLAGVQVAMGILALSTLYLYGSTFNVMRWLVVSLPKTDMGYLLFNLSSHGIAMAIMLPATFCAGMTLPLITYALLRDGYGERSIGAVYAANTVGAIVGVFAAIHVGMPLLGLKKLISSGAALDILLGVALFWSLRSIVGFRRVFTAAGMGMLALAMATLSARLDVFKMASGVYRRSQKVLSPASADVVFHKDGKTATVDLIRLGSEVGIRTNGKVDAAVNMLAIGDPTGDEYTMVLSGALPLLLYPEATDAANIGLGSGISTHVLLSSPILRQVDTVEIEEAMVEAAREFWPRNARAYDDPRSRIHIEDAKTFFSTHNKSYDILVSEPSNPWVSGVAGLFSEEYYRLIARHLADKGVFVQWLQLYEFNVPLVASVLKALSPNFTDFAIYAVNPGDLLIVATKGRLVPEPQQSIFVNADLASALARVGVNNVQDIAIRKVCDKWLLDPWLASVPVRPNSDYYPVLDQAAARTRFLGESGRDFVSISFGPVQVLDTLGRAVHRWSHTIVTPSPAVPVSAEAHRATLFRDLIGRTNDGDNTPSSGPAAQAKMLLLDCKDLTSRSADKKRVLFDLGRNLVPYLLPDELETIWQQVETLPCGSNLTQGEREWMDLLRSAGNRNGARMAVSAERLLKADSEGADYRHYLLAVALLGHIAAGDKARAATLWNRYGVELGNGPYSLLMRVLAAHVLGALAP